MVFTLTENFIIQSEPEKQKKSEFGEKIQTFVRFWIKSFTTRQISDWKKYNALDFELKTFRHVRFWKKKFAFKKSRSGSFYFVKTTYFTSFVHF